MNMIEQSGNGDIHQEEEKAHRIAALIVGYIHKALTREEHDELDQWVGENDENMRLFEELTDETASQQALDWLRDADGPRILKKIKGNLIFTPVRRPLFRKVWHYVVAISAILTVGTSVFFIYRDSDKIDTELIGVNEEKVDFEPGQARAILTLADGSTIILEQSKNDTTITQGNTEITNQDGQFRYNIKGQGNATIFYNTITTPRGASFTLTLSDGSRLWLNASSSVTFPTVFTGNERKIVMSGEIYFEVAKDAEKPLRLEVKDKEMLVEVLGARFNINAYQDEELIRTTLLEGSVRISKGDKSSFLEPGQQAHWDTAGEINILTDADITGVTAWKDGLFHFNNTDIKSIMREVSRWYDVDIEFESDINTRHSCLISRNIPASKLFKILEETGEVDFKLEEKKVRVMP